MKDKYKMHQSSKSVEEKNISGISGMLEGLYSNKPAIKKAAENQLKVLWPKSYGSSYGRARRANASPDNSKAMVEKHLRWEVK